MEQHGRLDVLVNNAGIGIGGSIIEMPLSDWQRQQAINLDGVFLGMKHCIPPMRDSGGGSIINMSSVAGLKGSARLAGYNATKGGVRLLTKGVALECAHERWLVRVNSVHPGIIDTPIWDPVLPGALQAGADELNPELMAAGRCADRRARHATRRRQRRAVSRQRRVVVHHRHRTRDRRRPLGLIAGARYGARSPQVTFAPDTRPGVARTFGMEAMSPHTATRPVPHQHLK